MAQNQIDLDGYWRLILEAHENSTNINANTSNVYWSLKIQSYNGRSCRYGRVSYSVTLNGATIAVIDNDDFGVGTNDTITLLDGTRDIGHNNDGTGSVNFGGNFVNRDGADYTPPSGSVGLNLGLSTIPRVSQQTLSTGEVQVNGSNYVVIYTNRKSSSFTHDIYLNFGGRTNVKIASGVTDAYTFVVPTYYLDQIPNNAVGQGGIWMDTYNGGQKIGTSQTSYIRLNAYSYPPLVSDLKVEELNEYVKARDPNCTVLGVSSKKITVKAVSQMYASMKSAYCDEPFTELKKSTTQADYWEGIRNNPDDGYYRITATDSRGIKYDSMNTSLTSAQKTYNYSVPTFTSVSVARPSETSSNGTLKVEAVITDILQNYVVDMTVKRDDQETVEHVTPTVKDGKVVLSKSYTDLYYQKAYSFTITITDYFRKTSSIEAKLSRGQMTFGLGREYTYAQRLAIKLPQNLGSDTWTDIFDAFYPVGSIYQSISSTDPNLLFGGKWERLNDMFLYATNDQSQVGSKGGMKQKSLRAAIGAVKSNIGSLGYVAYPVSKWQSHTAPTYATLGSSEVNLSPSDWNHSVPVTDVNDDQLDVNIMPPYMKVNMWIRTA